MSDTITEAFRIAQEIRIDPFALNRKTPDTSAVCTGIFGEVRVRVRVLRPASWARLAVVVEL